MEGVATQTRIADVRMAELSGQITAQEAAWLRHSAATEKAAQNMRNLTATFAAFGAAIGIASVGYGLKEAADLQSAVVSAAINAPGTKPDAIRSLALKVSGITAQSATTIAKEFAVAASSGLSGKQLIQGGMFKDLAMAADVLNLGPKRLAPEDSIKQLTQLAHIFGAYQTTAAEGAKGSYGAYRSANLHDMLENAVKMMSMQPEGLDKMITQGRLFIGDAMFHGVSMQEIFRQYMLMGQTGQLRGRGGAGIENYLDYLTGGASITNYAGTKRGGAFAALSAQGERAGIGSLYDAQGRLRFVDEKGNLHLEASEKWLAQLGRYMTQGGQQQAFATELNNAFGKQGRNFVVMAISPQTQHQMVINTEKWNQIGGIQKQFSEYMNTFNSQFKVTATNFKNVVMDVYTPLLPGFTHLFRDLGDGLKYASAFLDKHPDLAGMIGFTTIGIAGYLTRMAARIALSGPSIAASSLRIETALTSLAGTMATDGAVIAGGSVAAGRGLTKLAVGLDALSGPLGIVLAALTAAPFIREYSNTHPWVRNAGSAAHDFIWNSWATELRLTGHSDLVPSLRRVENGLTQHFHGQDAAPKRAAPANHFHAPVNINIDGAQHPKKVADLVLDALKNPLHAMNVNAPQTRTHPNVPFVFSALGHTG